MCFEATAVSEVLFVYDVLSISASQLILVSIQEEIKCSALEIILERMGLYPASIQTQLGVHILLFFSWDL